MHKEEMRASLARRAWNDLPKDIRYARRMLWKSPVFTAIAIGSLALGIGANTAIFTLAKEMLLDRLHVSQPEELRLLSWTAPENTFTYHIWGKSDKVNGQITSPSFSYPVYRELREQNRKQGVLGDLFAFKDIGNLTATVDGQARVVHGEMISGNYYGELGVIPQLGRSMEPADDAAEGAGAVVVISDGFWRSAFASSPEVIGKVFTINGQLFTVIGVNRPEFTGASSAHQSPQVFVPFSVQPVLIPRTRAGAILEATTEWWVQIMARAKQGISETRADAALSATLTASVQNSHMAKSGEAMPRVQMEDGSRGENSAARQYRQPVAVLLAVAGLVLLLACANLANLLLALASSREREVAVRLALGAGRGRILRQALTESLMLSFAGGTAGFALGWASRNVIPKLMSRSPWDPTQLSARIDWGVLAFTAILSLLTGLLFGIVPAVKATRTQASSGLKEGAAAITRRRTGYVGKAIVVLQVALSTLLVVGAGLFLRTISNLNHVNLGFRVDHLLLFEISQPKATYPSPKDMQLHGEITQRLAVLPGVESITSSAIPLISGGGIVYPWEPLDNAAKVSEAVVTSFVGDRFFATMGMPIVAGHDFGPQESESGQTVGIVNESLARQTWGAANVIGRHFKVSDKLYTTVGVVNDAAYNGLKEPPPPQLFLSYRQLPYVPGLTYEVRTQMPAASVAGALQKAVAGIDPNLPLIALRTQQQQIDASVGDERMFASLTAGFGLLALVLASIGIYGVMAYTVAERTREIGIRVALGARAGKILTMVLGETWRLTLIGVIGGLSAAFVLTRLVKEMLYGVKTYDPVTLASSTVLLCLVAFAAGFTPARRASKVDPMTALRHE
jgi:predicted permease